MILMLSIATKNHKLFQKVFLVKTVKAYLEYHNKHFGLIFTYTMILISSISKPNHKLFQKVFLVKTVNTYREHHNMHFGLIFFFFLCIFCSDFGFNVTNTKRLCGRYSIVTYAKQCFENQTGHRSDETFESWFNRFKPREPG